MGFLFWSEMQRFRKISHRFLGKFCLIFGGFLLAIYLAMSFSEVLAGPVDEIISEPVVEAGQVSESETGLAEKSELKPLSTTPRANQKNNSTAAAKTATKNSKSWSYINISGKISTAITPVGLDSTGAIAVPASAAGLWRAGDYAPVFLDGHSDGVFAGLKNVTTSDVISITLGDGSVLKYQVDSRKIYDYDPSIGVYDNRTGELTANGTIMSDSIYTGGPDGLNLMTCYGKYLANYGTYNQRLVVFASRI